MLKPLQTNKYIVLLSGDKDSFVVILDISFYKVKIDRLINHGVSKGVYVIEENGNTLTELKPLKIVSIGLLRNMKNIRK